MKVKTGQQKDVVCEKDKRFVEDPYSALELLSSVYKPC